MSTSTPYNSLLNQVGFGAPPGFYEGPSNCVPQPQAWLYPDEIDEHVKPDPEDRNDLSLLFPDNMPVNMWAIGLLSLASFIIATQV